MPRNAKNTVDWGYVGPKKKTGSHARTCDWPGCDEIAEHRAPKARETLNEYFWFCQEHAREYNAGWNYYEGMTEDEVEADRRRDTTWNRPSWTLGTVGGRNKAYAWGLGGMHDVFGVMGDKADPEDPAPQGPRADTPEGEAMALLGLDPPLNEERLKACYKKLVKRYHPDANGGDKDAEEKFKRINQAYRVLKDFLGI